MKPPVLNSQSSGQGTGAEPKPDQVDLGAGWRAEIFDSWDFPLDLVQRWDGLAQAYGDKGIFLRIGWLQTWWSVFGGDGRLFIVVLYSENTVRGIFPCWITPEGYVDGTTNEVYYDFLVADSHRADTIARFVRLLDRTRRSRAHFPYLSQLEANGPLLEDRLRRGHYPFWKWEQQYGARVDVSKPSWEEVEGTFHSKLRNNLKKGRRRAEKEGVLTFAEVSNPDAVEAALGEAFGVEGSGWKAAKGTAIILSESKSAWYRSISLWAARQGALRIYLLRLGGRLIAFDLDIVSGHTVFALKTGFDEEVATRFSAGNLMRYELLKHLWAHPDIHRYDFLGPTYAWKLEWTQDTDTCTDVSMYPKSLRGWMDYMAQHGWKQPLKRSRRLVKFVRAFGAARDRDSHAG